MAYEVLRLVNGPLEQNCWFLREKGRAEGLLIDPGSSPAELRRALDEAQARPALIVATHGHFDHVGAAADLAQAYQAPFAMAEADQFLLEDLEDQAAFYGLGPARRPRLDLRLQAGPLPVAGLDLQILATPGHTPGGLCFYHPASKSLFSGDSLFQGSVGRSDFPGGSHEQLIASIRRELLPLPEATAVLPGHGESSSLGREKRENRFLS